jgi:hypothetical protein
VYELFDAKSKSNAAKEIKDTNIENKTKSDKDDATFLIALHEILQEVLSSFEVRK